MTLLLKESEEERIHRIADELQPEIREAFLAAVATLKDQFPTGEIASLLEESTRDALSAISELGLSREQLDPIRQALLETTTQAASATAAQFGLAFDAVNDRAVAFASAQAASAFDLVDDATMNAVRDVIVRGQRGDVNVREQARLIRDIVGLTPKDALAVDRFYSGLIENGWTQDRARKATERMSNRLLNQRAENIARTETIRAANRGTELGWLEAQDKGLLPRQGIKKTWIATADSRTCPICSVLDGQLVDVSGSFDIREKATSFDIEGDSITVRGTAPLKHTTQTRTPPAHPRCRCTVGIEVIDPDAPPEDPQQRLRDLNEKDLAKYEPGGEKGPRKGIDDVPEIREHARELYEEALRREPGQTALIGEIRDATGGEYYGLDFRVKTEASLREKIRREIRDAKKFEDLDLTIPEAAGRIRDMNRYTLTWEPDASYSKRMLSAEQALNDAGWETIKNKNYWV